jgi:membrane protein insertase Oxa1/YidC/SpoIIIJ
MVRGMLTVLILPLFKGLRSITDYVTGGWLAALILMTITVIAAIMTKETFNKDLNYTEPHEMAP